MIEGFANEYVESAIPSCWLPCSLAAFPILSAYEGHSFFLVGMAGVS